MTDARKPPSAGARPGGTNPGTPRPVTTAAVTAARAQPLRSSPAVPKNAQELKLKLASETSNVALNVLAILKETWDDFRSSDRFFKFKALIIALWIALSGVGIWIATRPG